MNQATKYWFLEGFDFAKKLGLKATMRLSKELEMDYLTKGEKVWCSHHQEVIFLKKGIVKIVDGTSQQTKFMVKSHHIFGQFSWDDDEGVDSDDDEFAMALADVIICRISSEKMSELMEIHSSLKNSVFKFQQFRLKRLERRLSDLLYKDSHQRIEDFLKSCVQEHGELVNGSLEVKNVLTHKDIAHLTNTSRQTVNNVISQLRKEGVMEYSRQVIRMDTATE